MNVKIKKLYRELEMAHSEESYNSLAKSISKILENQKMEDKMKLDIIECYINDYFQELNYTSETEYL